MLFRDDRAHSDFLCILGFLGFVGILGFLGFLVLARGTVQSWLISDNMVAKTEEIMHRDKTKDKHSISI